MKTCTLGESKRASGGVGRRTARLRRAIGEAPLRHLFLTARGRGVLAGAVFGAALLAVAHAGGIERPPDDVVADTGEVLHAAAADEHDGVFLEAVPFPGD